jgi:hypothetical protein|tara:strand:+ start:717 stop:1673 length:957 start_codon:yes stop_codon:yes gene_type:complete
MAHLPGKRKTTPSGWTSFNAPCCHNNGNTVDKRGRGGLISEGETVSYHCFNCGYKASWQPGRPVSHKLRKLLQWLNCSDDIITKLTFDVMRINDGVEVAERVLDIPTFDTVPLPPNSVKIASITEFNKFSITVLEYMAARNLNLDDTDYYWSDSLAYRDRLIIPFYYEKRIVGWTARTITPDKKPKYLNEQQPGFVYGLDEQNFNKVFCIVVEGPVDAIHIDGCAIGGSEINDQQAMLINKLGKDIIVVPDRDKAGSKLVEQAIENGWGVSLPSWDIDINDVGDAVDKYGRLYTLYSIANAAETSPLKIRLRAKKWFI